MVNRENRENLNERSWLISIAVSIVSIIVTVVTDFLVVQLQGCQVLPGLTELSLLHALPDKPMNEGSLGVHEVELVVQPGPGLHDGGGVGQTAHCSHHFGQISSRNH